MQNYLAMTNIAIDYFDMRMDYFTIRGLFTIFASQKQPYHPFPLIMIKIKDGFQGERAYVLPPACVSELEHHPLSAILHITDIGFYPQARNHHRERREPLNQYVFIYCASGSGWYVLDGRRHEVHSDSYFILPPGKPHSYGASHDDPWTIYWIHYNGSLASEFLPEHSQPIEIKPGIRSRIADRIDIFEEIMSTLDKGFGRENLLYACSVFHHFLGSLRFLNQYRSSHFDSEQYSDMTDAAIHFMNENIGKNLRLSEIAQYTGYSTSQFSSRFAKRTGMAPMEYFNHLKIRHACRLLDFTSLHINQICHTIGISDPYYFSRLFKKIMGLSPMAYRSKTKG